MKRLTIFLLLCLNVSLRIMAQRETESKAFQLSAEDGYEMQVKTTLNQTVDTLEIGKKICINGLSLTGTIVLPNHNSFVRVLLQDEEGKEYLVLETSRLYNDTDTLYLFNYCEETKNLPAIYPHQLLLFSENAIVNISNITLKVPKDDNVKDKNKAFGRYKEFFKQSKAEQANLIVERINENNKKHNRLWRAEVTDISLLQWEDKRKVLGIDGRYRPSGFEYYSSGIFELGEPECETDALSCSPYADSFDWRNRHGINWMTSVKHQSSGSGCWAFAAIGVTEALVNLYFNRKIDCDLSEQEVISCSGCGSNSSGGYEGSALNWISNHGVSEESAFPFSNSDEPCSNTGNYSELITMSGTSYVQNHKLDNNDSIKKALIKYGPLTSGFMYNNGKYHGHAMTLVGYSTLHEGDTIRFFGGYSQSPNNFVVIQSGDSRIGKTYWIFKNSYGTNRYYEHEGYAYILFNDQACFRTPYYAKTPILSQLYSDDDIVVTDNDGDGYYSWGIGQKPSHCPNWIPDQPDGDDSNYSIGPMDEYGNNYNLAAHVNDVISIMTDTVWTTKRYIYNNITVPGGVTLTIQSDVIFYNGAKISLQGGRLHVDGGHLSNAVIESSPNSDVVISNAGVIEESPNSTFEIPLGVTLRFNSGNIN